MEIANKLYRRTDERVLAGVAAGIAAHVRLPKLWIRLAFVLLLGLNGLGAALYAVFWMVLPIAPRTEARRKRDYTQLVAFCALAVGIVIIQFQSTDSVVPLIGWLIAVVALGAGIIWHQAEPDRWRRLTGSDGPDLPWLAGLLTTSDRRSLLFRLVGGGALVIAGIIGSVALTGNFPGVGLGSILNGLLFALVALAGVALVIGPLLWRMFVQLRDEREGRVRETERAELAGIVHDQVLHTLALIQRHIDDPKTVQRLARGQERTLRNWLYKPTGSPDERFAAALEAAAAEVEDTYAVGVDLVVVGDCAVDEHVRALVHATREAMVNAGKHAGVETISVYAEAEPAELSVFVRDRGVGFDPAVVEADRHGVRGSILGRMERHGGRAEIRSEPGDGTEVRLTLPRGKEGE